MFEYLYKALEAVGLGDSQPQFLQFDTGIVLYAVPGLNSYYVIPSQNMGGPGDPLFLTAFALNGSTLKYGATVAESYQPGTMVILARVGTSPDPAEATGTDMTIILGSVPRQNIIDPADYPDRSLFPGVGVDYYTTPFVDSMKTAQPKTDLLKDHSYGRPLESLGGDWSVVNDFKNFVMVGHQYAGIGSLRAKVESHSVHNRLRLTADDLRMEGLCLESVARPDEKDALFYVRKARSVLEGLGVAEAGAIPFKQNDDNEYERLKDDQQGIFRHEEYEGELVEGIWRSLLVPETPDGARTWSDSSKPPFGVDSEHTLYDGEHSRRNALQTSSVKSPYVPVVRALQPEEKLEEYPKEDEGKEWKDDQGVSDDDYPNVAPANNTDEFDHNTGDYWRKRLRARTDNWKVYTPDELQGEYGGDMKRRKEIDALEEDTQDYELPPVMKVKDPATGVEKEYYCAESFIRQLPDGSISLSDGYGSEIRMVRGRIIVSPATDLEFRPGRDMSVMAGRHASVNAGDSLFLQAEHGSTYAKAQKDFRILAGADQEGTLVLEGRGLRAAEKINSNDPERKVAGGVVVKSDSNLIMAGVDTYIGINDSDDKSANGMARTVKGTLLIDAGAGTLGLLGDSLYGTFASSATLTCVAGGTGSGLAMGAGHMGLYASNLDLAAAQCLVKTPSGGTVNVKTIGPGGVQNKTLRVNGGQTTMYVGGSIKAQTNVYAGSTMSASNMTGGHGSFGGATEHYSHAGGSSPTVKVPSLKTDLIKNAGDSFEKSMDAADPTMYKALDMLGTGFAYPTSKDMRISEYKLYAARWQNMLKSPKTWSNKEVDNSDATKKTMTYPGKEMMETGESFFHKVDEKSILKDNYIINTTQEG